MGLGVALLLAPLQVALGYAAFSYGRRLVAGQDGIRNVFAATLSISCALCMLMLLEIADVTQRGYVSSLFNR